MSRVTVIGVGLLGRGIAEVLIGNGHEVVLHDFSIQALGDAYRSLALLGSPSGGRVTAEKALDKAVDSADYIVEAVTENLELKQSIFERVGDANPRAILMSNSSVLPIGSIARRTTNPERAVGAHWWNPPQLIPVVEIIRGPLTDDDTMDRAMEFHETLGKMSVRVERDVPGFIGNRIQHALWREALSLVSKGECDPYRVDTIVASTLGKTFSIGGPFEQMRRLGSEKVIEEFKQALPLIDSSPHPAPMLSRKVAQGYLGAKSGVGFFTWELGSRELAAGRLYEHVRGRLGYVSNSNSMNAQAGSLPLHPDDERVAVRLRVAVWREALSLVEKKVCTALDVDRVVRNTIGLRLAEMGPVRNADYVGLDLTLAIHEAVLPTLEASTSMPASLIHKTQSKAASSL